MRGTGGIPLPGRRRGPGDSPSRCLRDAEDPAQPGAQGCGGFPPHRDAGAGAALTARRGPGKGKGDVSARLGGMRDAGGRKRRRCPGPERLELLFPTSALSWKRLLSTRARPGHADGGCRGLSAGKFPVSSSLPVPSGPCEHSPLPEFLPVVLLSSRTLTFILGHN